VSGPVAAPEQPEPLAGWRWWAGLSAGGAVGLLGLAGLLRDATKTMPLVWLRWLVGLVLVHDLVLAPLVLLAGRWLRDRAPEPWRWPLRLGLVTSGVLVLASVPVLYGVGRRTQPGNASVLPGNYPLALAGVLVVVWLGVLALGISGAAILAARRAALDQDDPGGEPEQGDGRQVTRVHAVLPGQRQQHRPVGQGLEDHDAGRHDDQHDGQGDPPGT
jgi:hypothetical protein